MAQVGCAGILVADTFCGPMNRLPLAGELLAIDRMPSMAGGCAANVAIDLAKQGIASEVCGCVGADPDAEVLLKNLQTEQQISRLFDCGVGTVVITHGSEGSVAAQGRQRWRAETYRVNSIDPSGSGDAFAAGVIAGILRRWDMAATLRYAAALGASATTAIGTTDGVFDSEQAAAYVGQHDLHVARSEREEV